MPSLKSSTKNGVTAIYKSNTLVIITCEDDNLPEELSLEIRKFEVRLKEYVEAEDKTIKSLKTLVEKLRELNSFIKSSSEKNLEKLDKIMELLIQVIKAFHDALSCISKAEYEKSHLSESYGKSLSALEKQIQKIQHTKKHETRVKS